MTRSYFAENATFPESYFRHHFRMSINLFKKIAEDLKKYDMFFEQRRSVAGELGHSTEQKITDVFRMLAYGIPADLVDDRLAMGESQAIKCVKRFAVTMVKVFGEVYLRVPNEADMARLIEFNKNHGFSGFTLGDTPPVQFQVNGRTYNFGYFLADDIYPK
nr:uncharacterized protein LOC127340060 [Lolium perenne]